MPGCLSSVDSRREVSNCPRVSGSVICHWVHNITHQNTELYADCLVLSTCSHFPHLGQNGLRNALVIQGSFFYLLNFSPDSLRRK